MAKTKLKSVFTREDVYTVLQLLKALADGVDTNEELTDADIEKLKTSVDKLNGAVSIAEDNTTTIANGIVIKPTGDVDIGKNLDVDGLIRLNTPDDLTFVTGSLPKAKTYYQHTVRMELPTQEDGNMGQGIYFTALSTSNVPIDSYSDLHTVFGGRDIAVTGFIAVQCGPTSWWQVPVTYLDLHGGSIATDKVGVTKLVIDTSQKFEYSLSELDTITFKDDVCLL